MKAKELLIVGAVALLAVALAIAARHFRTPPPIELQPYGIPK